MNNERAVLLSRFIDGQILIVPRKGGAKLIGQVSDIMLGVASERLRFEFVHQGREHDGEWYNTYQTSYVLKLDGFVIMPSEENKLVLESAELSTTITLYHASHPGCIDLKTTVSDTIHPVESVTTCRHCSMKVSAQTERCPKCGSANYRQ